MDSLVTAAARALAAGDPLGALERIALRDDPPALALRGIAMAQLGELARARRLLRRAARSFGPDESLERARCLAAEAEVALAARDLAWPARALAQAVRTFTTRRDHTNRVHAQVLQIRLLLLLGRVEQAAAAHAVLDVGEAPEMVVANARLLAFEIAVRRGEIDEARAALAQAEAAAARARIPALRAEVELAGHALDLPAARLIGRGQQRPLTLAELASVLPAPHLVVDACRRAARRGPGRREVALARRPVLFALLRTLAEAWPSEATREHLIERAFGVQRVNASHRARLRVEIGRLRQQLRGLAEVRAAGDGFVVTLSGPGEVLVLAPPIESPAASVLALLADGEAWSTSALALALGQSQRTLQRALAVLLADGKVRALAGGRARRWLASPIVGFTTTLLLPTSRPAG